MLPPWLAQHLINNGTITPDGTSRAARAQRCRHCSALILRGLDETHCAFDTTVDIDPVTQIGEIIALTNGKRSYFLLRESTSTGRSTWTINRRELHHHQANKPAIIVTEHKCGTQTPKEHLNTNQDNNEQPKNKHNASDEPPF